MVAYWFCAVFTLVSSGVSLGYSLAAARGSSTDRSAAEYALARSVALTVVSVVPLFGERHSWLVAAAIAMIVVQAGDGVVGLRLHDRVKTAGPAATAAVNLALLIWYLA